MDTLITRESTELKQKNEAAIKLIEKWINDDSDFEEKTWPLVKEIFEERDKNKK